MVLFTAISISACINLKKITKEEILSTEGFYLYSFYSEWNKTRLGIYIKFYPDGKAVLGKCVVSDTTTVKEYYYYFDRNKPEGADNIISYTLSNDSVAFYDKELEILYKGKIFKDYIEARETRKFYSFPEDTTTKKKFIFYPVK